MPCYPAFALLIGSGIAMNGRVVRRGTRFLTVTYSIAAVVAIAILLAVRHVPTPGDISQALSSNPEAYTLSLGHMEDLTLKSFAYLRVPLALAAASFLIGAIGTVRTASKKVYITVAIMMVIVFHGARLDMIS